MKNFCVTRIWKYTYVQNPTHSFPFYNNYVEQIFLTLIWWNSMGRSIYLWNKNMEKIDSLRLLIGDWIILTYFNFSSRFTAHLNLSCIIVDQATHSLCSMVHWASFVHFFLLSNFFTFWSLFWLRFYGLEKILPKFCILFHHLQLRNS